MDQLHQDLQDIIQQDFTILSSPNDPITSEIIITNNSGYDHLLEKAEFKIPEYRMLNY